MELVGFGSLLENSYDAICVSEADSKIELASVYALSSLAIGRFAQDVADAVRRSAAGPVLLRRRDRPQQHHAAEAKPRRARVAAPRGHDRARGSAAAAC